MSVWPNFTKQNPCPACGHGGDWCCRGGTSGFVCMRVQSPRMMKDGGWFHFYDDKKPKPAYIPPPRKAAPPLKNADKILDNLYNDPLAVSSLASSLGVAESALHSLGFKWSPEHKAFACPMRNGENEIIGIHLRSTEGKKAITGSRLGLFIPQGIEPQKVAMICEGASDCAALLTMGYFAIGRPSCSFGAAMIKVALKRLGVHRCVVVADNDGAKTNGKRPGLEGAVKLKKELGMMSVIWMPPSPIKDVREFVKKGGTRGMIENDIAHKIWTPK